MSWPDLLAQVKDELGIEQSDTGNDVALRRKFAAACVEIERAVGHVDAVPFVRTFDVGCDGMVVLPERPVAMLGTPPIAAVTSVQLLGAGDAVARDFGAGTDTDSSGVLYGLPAGRVRIAWVAGRNPIPADVLEAVVLQTAHMWRQSRSLDGQGRVRADMMPGPGMSSAMPNKVKELLGLTGKSNRSAVLVG